MAAVARMPDSLQVDVGMTDVVRRASKGDEGAWATLVDSYSRRVFAMARCQFGRTDLAEEITQSVFVTVAEKLASGEYQEVGKFEAWLFRVAVNRIRDEQRRWKRHAAPSAPEVLARVAMPEGETRADDSRLAALRSAIDRLSEADREVIHLRHHAELSFGQIADLLEEPVGTLLARHHRALRKLKSMMESGT